MSHSAPRLDSFSHRSTRAAVAAAGAIGFAIPVSVALDNILLGVVLLAWLAGGGPRSLPADLPRTRVAQAALALFALLAAGILWSAHPAEGLHVLGKYADLVFVPVFATLFHAAADRRRAAACLIAALLLTLVLSYLTRAGLVPQGYPSIGTPAEPEVFKKYLTQNILMACGAFLFAVLAREAATPRARLAWSAAAAFAAVNVLFMLSGRSGQIILVLLAAYFCIAAWRWRGVLALVLAAVLAAGVLTAKADNDALSQPAGGPRKSGFATVLRDFEAWREGRLSSTSTAQRLDYAVTSLAILREHPLAGVGTGGFADAYARQVEGSRREPTVNPHNEYLNLGVQLGLPGIALLVLLFALVWREAAALPTALERDLARGLALAFAAGSLLNSLLMDHAEGLFFAWSAGVLFGGLAPRPPQEPAP